MNSPFLSRIGFRAIILMIVSACASGQEPETGVGNEYLKEDAPDRLESFGNDDTHRLLLERSKLTGDWLGKRSLISDCGFNWDIHNTHFYSGVASG
ncbi:MAG TPA: hypothetical protein DCF63_20585, partial [Planctomycetaceae bacterium]|nr:hypothetical protein [Planctomycetaceae bacterium]